MCDVCIWATRWPGRGIEKWIQQGVARIALCGATFRNVDWCYWFVMPMETSFERATKGRLSLFDDTLAGVGYCFGRPRLRISIWGSRLWLCGEIAAGFVLRYVVFFGGGVSSALNSKVALDGEGDCYRVCYYHTPCGGWKNQQTGGLCRDGGLSASVSIDDTLSRGLLVPWSHPQRMFSGDVPFRFYRLQLMTRYLFSR